MVTTWCHQLRFHMTNHSHFQPRCFLWNHFMNKRNQKCWCSMKDGVFISGLASLSQSLPHTTIHYLPVGQGKLSWGPIVCLVEFWLFVSVCLWHLYCAYRRCRGVQGWSLGSQRKVLASGGLSSPLALAGLLGKPDIETVGLGGGGSI